MKFLQAGVLVALTAFPGLLFGQGLGEGAVDCTAVPNYTALKSALQAVAPRAGGGNGGLNLNMWGTVVNRDGEVCAVVFTGPDRGAQWPGSRVISAQKANTANAFSLDGLALSTANLFSAVQPGGSLFGLSDSNPVDTSVAYGGRASEFGQPSDPMVRKRVGGVNVFGGGLGLYNAAGDIVGGLGVSGDTSCTDHVIAWKVRHMLNMDNIPGGVSASGTDNIIFDIQGGVSTGGFGHPTCIGTPNPETLEAFCPAGPEGALSSCASANVLGNPPPPPPVMEEPPPDNNGGGDNNGDGTGDSGNGDGTGDSGNGDSTP